MDEAGVFFTLGADPVVHMDNHGPTEHPDGRMQQHHGIPPPRYGHAHPAAWGKAGRPRPKRSFDHRPPPGNPIPSWSSNGVRGPVREESLSGLGGGPLSCSTVLPLAALLTLGLAVSIERLPYIWRMGLRHRRLLPMRRQVQALGLDDTPAGVRGRSYQGRWCGRALHIRLQSAERVLVRVELRDPSLSSVQDFVVKAIQGRLRTRGNRLGAAALVDTQLRALLQDRDRVVKCGAALALEARNLPLASDLQAIVRRLGEGIEELVAHQGRLERLVLERMRDPEVTVRRHAFAVLWETNPDSSETKTALELARNDHQAWVRMQAFRVMEDWDQVLALAMEPGVPVELLVEALSCLPDPSSRVQLLERVVFSEPRTAKERLSCLEAAMDAGSLPGPLVSRALHDPDRRVRVQAVGALASLHNGESVLLDILQGRHSSQEDLDYWGRISSRAAAAEVLGRVGTGRCLGPLRRMCEGAGLVAPLSEPARRALSRLEQRWPHLTSGSISFAPTPAPREGSLSIPDESEQR